LATTRVVVQRPEWTDTACHWGQYWMKVYVVDPFRKAGCEVVDLFGDKAIRTEVLKACKRSNFVYFSGLGHGNATTFTGQRKQPIFWKGDKETCAISDGHHFNFLSCVFGKEGAKWMAEECGAIGVHGYKESFYFVVSTYPNSVAKPFFDAHTTVDRELLKGKTHGSAHNACIARFNYWIAHAPNDAAKRYLIHDRNCKVFYGNRNAKLPPCEHICSGPIDNYKVVVYAKLAGNLRAYIHCYYKRKLVLTCAFYKDGAALPDNNCTAQRAMLTYHWSHFDDIMDILRNEKPVYYMFIAKTKVGYINTLAEPVGEGEE
jgi:hypothetical protein